MNLLLRELTGHSGGLPTYTDAELSGDAITVGSAPNQQIQLLGHDVQGSHAVLRAASGGLSVQCRRPATVRVNGKDTRSATLTGEDLLEIAGHKLRVIAAPAGFDAALELVPDPDVDSSDYEAAFTTSLEQTWLSRRAPAWTLLGLVLLLTLVLPLAYVLLRDGDQGPPVVPTDAFWTSGPLHPAHELAIGDDCAACHSQLLHRVKDADCRACHDPLADHVAQPRTVELEIPQQRCATCHREHNEPEYLVITADGQCTDCHADPHAFAQPLQVAAVSGFAAGSHPAFSARLLSSVATQAGTGLSFDWRYHIESVAEAREDSNLLFPHDIHLDEVKVRNPNDDSAMSCGDCHVLADDREHFVPITMQKDCASCHELTFDVTEPDRQLPHGLPREVAFAIEGYYAKKFLDPDADDAGPTRRRRPGRSSESERCEGSPAACARSRTLQEVTNQFTVRGCVACHEVAETEATDVYSRFQVYPVRLVRDYFESARFDHASHLTLKDVTGDAACLTCHKADTSGTSEDLLIPDLDNCTQCHGDPTVPDVVALQCVGCHEFHPPSHGSRRTTLDVVGREEAM